MSERTQQLDIVFDGPPGPEPGRLVEVEVARTGESIRVGKWIDRGDGTWALRLTAVVSDEAPGHVPGTNILDGKPWGRTQPCTCTLACEPRGITDYQYCRESAL